MNKRVINISFTGSRVGLSIRQATALKMFIESLFCTYSVIRFHHGDCIGSDFDFNSIISSFAKKYMKKKNCIEVVWMRDVHVLHIL